MKQQPSHVQSVKQHFGVWCCQCAPLGVNLAGSTDKNRAGGDQSVRVITLDTARYTHTLCYSLSVGAGTAVISCVMSCRPQQRRPFASQEMVYTVNSKLTRAQTAPVFHAQEPQTHQQAGECAPEKLYAL